MRGWHAKIQVRYGGVDSEMQQKMECGLLSFWGREIIQIFYQDGEENILVDS